MDIGADPCLAQVRAEPVAVAVRHFDHVLMPAANRSFRFVWDAEMLALSRVLALVCFVISVVFVWRSFYRMRIEAEAPAQ